MKYFGPKLDSILTFPSLLACITLIVLVDTCIFAPLLDTQLGPFVTSSKSELLMSSFKSGAYASGSLGIFNSVDELVLVSPIVIAKLYKTHIFDQFEFLDESGSPSRFVVSQTAPVSLKDAISDAFSLKIPPVLANKFRQMTQWDPPAKITNSIGALYVAQKILRLAIVAFSFLSIAAKTIAFHKNIAVSIDSALMISCLSLIVTLCVSHSKLPMRFFPLLVSNLFLCFLCLLFEVVEQIMAEKFKNFIEKPAKCDVPCGIGQFSSGSMEAISTEIGENQIREQPLHDDTYSLAYEPENEQHENFDFARPNSSLINASDFEAVFKSIKQPSEVSNCHQNY